MPDDGWTTIRVSKRFKEWLESQGVFGKDKSVFDVLVRLLKWRGDE